MIINVSCYYLHKNRGDEYLIFVRYDELIKVYLSNNRPVVLHINDILNDDYLCQYYFSSLLVTKDVLSINYDIEGSVYEYDLIDNIPRNKWCIESLIDHKGLYFYDYYSNVVGLKRNPFTQQKPKRVSSLKKIKKFNKQFSSEFLNKIGGDQYDIFESILYNEYDLLINDIEEETNKILEKKYKIPKMAMIYANYPIPLDLFHKLF
jgi:hypothetical protein